MTFSLHSRCGLLDHIAATCTDLVGAVNGLLLLFGLKKDTVSIPGHLSRNKNLQNYKDPIPQLFWYNAAVLLSNNATVVSVRSRQIGNTSMSGNGSTTKAKPASLRWIPVACVRRIVFLDIVENFIVQPRGGNGEGAH